MDASFIIAIDYGTARSGFAYAQKGFSDQQLGVRFREAWQGQTGPKCDTALLLDQDGRVLEWGRPARISRSKYPNAYFHERVKMDLYHPEDQKKRGTPVDMTPDGPRRLVGGRQFYTVDLIAAFLAVMKREAVKQIWQEGGDFIKALYPELAGVLDGDDADKYFGDGFGNFRNDANAIKKFVYRQTWLLTLPANAEDEHKGLMRKAAYKAGLIENEGDLARLKLAFEPEMAAVYCGWNGQNLYRDGETFMVVDAGGGTVDVSAYRYRAQGEHAPAELEQVARSNATNSGSTYLDQAIWEFISRELFPNDANNENLNAFQNACEAEYLRMRYVGRDSLETLKEGTAPTDKRMSIDINYVEKWGQENKRAINAGSAFYDLGFFEIPIEKLHEIYRPVFEKAWEPVENVLQLTKARCDKQPDRFILVGGMGTSYFFEDFLLKKLEQKGMINGSNDIAYARLANDGVHTRQRAILHGAVMQGDRNRIGTRVAQFTYGTDCNTLYSDEAKKRFGELPEDRLYHNPHTSLNPWVHNAFSAFVQRGDQVKVDHVVERVYEVSAPDMRELKVALLRSAHQDPLYADQSDVDELQSLDFTIGGYGMGRSILVKMKFGETEIQTTVTEVGDESNTKTMVNKCNDSAYAFA